MGKRILMYDQQLFYVNGEWIQPNSSERIEVRSPSSEEIVGYAPAGNREDVANAVAAALAASTNWANTPVSQRAALLVQLCDGLERRKPELIEIFADQLGSPRALADRLHVGFALAEARVHAEVTKEFSWERQVGNSVIRREPMGVVAAITPWNFPLIQTLRKVAPALAAGCTVVLKPASNTPFDSFVLAEVAHEIGLPPGVLNVVTGSGTSVGEALAQHPDVTMVSFTGSTEAGQRVAQLAATTVKRVSLELGGKSPAVVLEGADFDAAVAATIASCFTNSGQACSALTRLIVPRARLQEVERIALEAASQFTVGRPDDASARMGPLVSAAQRDRVIGMVEQGIAEGARVLLDGRNPDIQGPGFFVGPTLLSDVKRDSTVAVEEIFGPVLSIIPVDDVEEAIDVANATIYGLAASVWGPASLARSVAEQISAGKIDINGGAFNFAAPFGGYKQSGIGRENGEFGFEEYLEVKAMQF